MDPLTQPLIALVNDAGVFGYWFAFIAAFAETLLVVGLLLPGSALILLMGTLAGQGYLDLGDLVGFAVAGAILGDNANYWLGRRYGRRWLSQDRWFFKTEHLHKAEDFFRRHGGKSVFLARFVPSLKEVVPFIAGMAHMRRVPFTLWNAVGAIGWAMQWVLPGYLFAQSLNLAHVWLSRIGFVILLFIGLLALMYGLRWFVLRYGSSGFRLAASLAGSITTAIRQNPDVAQWAGRHPKFTGFLRRRLDRTRLDGLPLTLVGIGLCYILMLFAGLVEDLLVKEAIVSADARVNNLLATMRSPLLDRLFYGVTTLGNAPVVMIGLGAASLILWWRHRERFVVPMLLASASAQGLTFLGKFAFQRPRPALGLLDPSSYSFPSGHASVSVAFYGFLCFMLMHRWQAWRTRVNIAFTGAGLAVLIGFSRLYLGVHYLSDVLAGYLVGGLGLLLGAALVYSGGFHMHRRLPVYRPSTWMAGFFPLWQSSCGRDGSFTRTFILRPI